MSLKLICGRAGSGKSTYMLNDMPQSSDTVYIVPEQFSFSAEKMMISRFGAVGLGNPQVLSFLRLSDTVFDLYGSPEFVADSASFEMLVSYCANSINPSELRLFDGLVKKSELSETASNIITTFKRYRITPEKLASAIEKTEDALLKKKLSDSLIVYEAYNRALREACVADQNDRLSVLSDILADEDCTFLDGKHIYIDQFTDFDPSEYECIKVMLSRAERVCIALCTDGNAQFETVNRTLRRLQLIAEECGVRIESTLELSDAMHNTKPMLRHLEQSYFIDDTPRFAGDDGSISIFCGKNKFSEIHNVARNIVKLVRDNGMRYRDISIIARDAGLYKSIIERVFPFYEIPVFVDKKMPLSGHSISMFITGILDIALGGFSYENIFAYIKSPFSPLTRDEADMLENYCIAAGVRHWAWSSPFTYSCGAYNSESNSYSPSYSPEKMEEINRLREKVYLPLEKLINNLRKKSTVCEICTYLFDFFEETSLEKKIRALSFRLEENGENLHALQTVQVYNILIEIFNDICTVLGNKTVSLREFYTTITVGLGAVEIGTIPSSSDCVTIGSIDRIKGHGAKVVFLVGVNSGIFPAYPSENGLFSDDDKKALEEMGIEMPPGLLHKAQSEQLLVYDALTCASEKLYLSYASADNSSQAMMPSEIAERITAIFPDINLSDDLVSLPDDESIITSKKAVFDMLCSKLRTYITEGKPLSDAMSAAAYYFSQDSYYAPLLRQAAEMAGFTNAPVAVDKNLISSAVGEEMKTSITKLEAYNKCPFSYFARYILNLEPRQSFEIKTSDSGSFLHDFLDKFSELIVNSVDSDGKPLTWSSIDSFFIKLNTPVILKEILTGVNSHLLETPRIKALFDRLCRTAEESVYAVREHIVKSDFIPMGYEISFDENGAFKPTKIKLADGRNIILRGRIDRADEFTAELEDGTKGKFVRIVDYKSSNKTLSLSDVYHGIQLQLFVYLSTLCDNGFSPAGILYCNLSDPIVEASPSASEEEIIQLRSKERRMKGIVLSEYGMFERMGGKEIIGNENTATVKNFTSMFRHLNKVIKKTADNICDGIFPIRHTKSACEWCDYKPFCRYDEKFDGCSTEEIPTYKDEEVWEMLEKEAFGNEMD